MSSLITFLRALLQCYSMYTDEFISVAFDRNEAENPSEPLPRFRYVPNDGSFFYGYPIVSEGLDRAKWADIIVYTSPQEHQKGFMMGYTLTEGHYPIQFSPALMLGTTDMRRFENLKAEVIGVSDQIAAMSNSGLSWNFTKKPYLPPQNLRDRFCSIYTTSKDMLIRGAADDSMKSKTTHRFAPNLIGFVENRLPYLLKDGTEGSVILYSAPLAEAILNEDKVACQKSLDRMKSGRPDKGGIRMHHTGLATRLTAVLLSTEDWETAGQFWEHTQPFHHESQLVITTALDMAGSLWSTGNVELDTTTESRGNMAAGIPVKLDRDEYEYVEFDSRYMKSNANDDDDDPRQKEGLIVPADLPRPSLDMDSWYEDENVYQEVQGSQAATAGPQETVAYEPPYKRSGRTTGFASEKAVRVPEPKVTEMSATGVKGTTERTMDAFYEYQKMAKGLASKLSAIETINAALLQQSRCLTLMGSGMTGLNNMSMVNLGPGNAYYKFSMMGVQGDKVTDLSAEDVAALIFDSLQNKKGIKLETFAGASYAHLASQAVIKNIFGCYNSYQTALSAAQASRRFQDALTIAEIATKASGWTIGVKTTLNSWSETGWKFLGEETRNPPNTDFTFDSNNVNNRLRAIISQVAN